LNSSLLNRSIARSTKTIEAVITVIIGTSDGNVLPMRRFVEYSGNLSGSTNETQEFEDPATIGMIL
jgi:hypothetical protein